MPQPRMRLWCPCVVDDESRFQVGLFALGYRQSAYLTMARPAVVATITESDLQAIGKVFSCLNQRFLRKFLRIWKGSTSGGASPASGASAYAKNLPNAWKLNLRFVPQ